MTISSWDAAYILAEYLGIDQSDAIKVAEILVPIEYNTSLEDFVRKSTEGLDVNALFTGAVISSIIMEKIRYKVDGVETVTCIICGNEKPVAPSSDDEFGWVCSECEHIYNAIRRMDMMKAMKRDKDATKGMYKDTGGDKDESA